MLLRTRLISNLLRNSQTNHYSSSSVSESVENNGKGKEISRKLVQALLISLTGGVALSALDDLSIYQSCSSKALERAEKDQGVIDALGGPLSKGPWYEASLALAHKRHSVSCTFPVSGPKGTGRVQLKAVRSGDERWIPFLRPRDWEILIMDAQIYVPANEEKNQAFRINIPDNTAPTACKECPKVKSQEPGKPEEK